MSHKPNQHTCAAVGTFAVERSHAVMAGGPLVARRAGAVVNILAAVVAGPAVHAHALVAAVCVVACAAVQASVGHELALIDIVQAELACGETNRGYFSLQWMDS